MLVPILEQGNEYVCVDTSESAGKNKHSIAKDIVATQTLNNVEQRILDLALSDLKEKGNWNKPLYAFTSTNQDRIGWILRIKEFITAYETMSEAKATEVFQSFLIDDAPVNNISPVVTFDYLSSQAGAHLAFVSTDKETGFPMIHARITASNLYQVVGIGGNITDNEDFASALLLTTCGQASSTEIEPMKKKLSNQNYKSVNLYSIGKHEEMLNEQIKNGGLPCKTYEEVCRITSTILEQPWGTNAWVNVMLYLTLCNSLHKKISKFKWVSYSIDLNVLQLKCDSSIADDFEEALSLFGDCKHSKLVVDKDKLVAIKLSDGDLDKIQHNHIMTVGLQDLKSIRKGSLIESNSAFYRLGIQTVVPDGSFGSGFGIGVNEFRFLSCNNFVLEPEDDWELLLNLYNYDVRTSKTVIIDFDRFVQQHKFYDFLVWFFKNIGKYLRRKSSSAHSDVDFIVAKNLPYIRNGITIIEAKGLTVLFHLKHDMGHTMIERYGIEAYSQAEIDGIRALVAKAYIGSLELEQFNGEEHETGVKMVSSYAELNFAHHKSANYNYDTALTSDIILLKDDDKSDSTKALVFEKPLYNMAGLIGRLNSCLVLGIPTEWSGDTDETSCDAITRRATTYILERLVSEGLVGYNEMGQADISPFSQQVKKYVEDGHTGIKYRAPELSELLLDCRAKLIKEICSGVTLPEN